MKILIALTALIGSSAFGAPAACPAPAADILKESTKLFVVITPSWNEKQGTIRLWERPSSSAKWTSPQAAQPMVLGEKGLAWGYRFKKFAKPGQPFKREGDGRTPAGVHALGKNFGFSPTPGAEDILITASTFCVDDPNSKFYNLIVDTTQVKKDWNSSEDMSKIDLYRRGMDVRYQSSAAEKAGSCIFLHIWRAPDHGTAGCVSMAESVLADLQSRLSPNAHPAMAVFPASEWAAWTPCFPGVTSK